MSWQEGASPSERMLNADQEQEARLAAQARAGAEWALTALIARYQPAVARYLMRLTGNPNLARTLAERIFIRMERRLHGPHGAEQLRLWLLRACTEAGLDALRHPKRKATPRLYAPAQPTALLTERAGVAPVRRLMAGWGRLKQVTNTTSRQVRQLIWTIRSETTGQQAWDTSAWARGSQGANPLGDASELDDPLEDEQDTLDPREALRHRLVRVVLAELPYGDAQCLALHLVAGLNQAEVARALGLTASATRRRIVHGLQAFSTRYAAALANLGASAELGLRERPAAPSTMAPSPRQRTISSDRGTLLPPTAVAGSQSYSPLADAATRERFDDGQPDAGFEQEPTMRLWPPAPPTPSADLDALEDENPTAPTIPIPATSPAQAAQPAAAMTWDEAARRGANEISEWGSWEEQPTANLPAASFGVTEAPPAPDETEASVTAASSEEPGEIGASHRTETIEAQETTGAPDGSAPQSEPGESQVGEALDGLPDEVEEGATTQPSLQRIARQAAIEEARRQLAAQAGAVERHGVVTPLARDAIIWPVVDALPIAPGASYPPAPTASSSATQTNKATNPPAVSNTGVRAAPDSPRQTGKLLAYEVSSPGTVEITVEHEGTSARATDVALTYEVSTQQKDEEHA